MNDFLDDRELDAAISRDLEAAARKTEAFQLALDVIVELPSWQYELPSMQSTIPILEEQLMIAAEAEALLTLERETLDVGSLS